MTDYNPELQPIVLTRSAEFGGVSTPDDPMRWVTGPTGGSGFDDSPGAWPLDLAAAGNGPAYGSSPGILENFAHFTRAQADQQQQGMSLMVLLLVVVGVAFVIGGGK